MAERQSLKFLIVGLGSMGKRRIRNLQANGENDIAGFDIRQDRNREAKEKYGIKIYDDFNKILPEDFDVLIISTSPAAHGDYIRYALKHKKHFFVEHPVNFDGYDDIFKNHDYTIKIPSCTFLFYQPIRMIKQFLDAGRIGKILAFQYHMGQYLPDWHPYEDYREVYFSQKETSACREMIAFEMIWLNWLIGASVKQISGQIAKLTDLDMSADDIALATLKYDNGVLGNIIIDVISRQPFRTLRILGSNGVLQWEKFEKAVKIYDASTKKTEIIPIPEGQAETGYVNEERMYNHEIKAFLDAIKHSKEYPHNFKDNYQLLQTMFALLESSATNKAINL